MCVKKKHSSTRAKVSVTLKMTCLKSPCHPVTSNCCRVCICVCVCVRMFLLFTANHRNGKPVSTVTLFSCSRVNVLCMTRTSRGGEGKRKGRVVIVLCFSLRRTFFNPVASWVWAAVLFSWSAKGSRHQPGKPKGDVLFFFFLFVFYPLDMLTTCMCPSRLSCVFAELCPSPTCHQSLNLDLTPLFIAFACLIEKKKTDSLHNIALKSWNASDVLLVIVL